MLAEQETVRSDAASRCWARRHVVEILAHAALVAVAVTLYLPVVGHQLVGDDYLVVQLAHWASHRPGLMFAAIEAFLRPTTTWTLAVDRLLWGYWAGGFHLR